MLNSIDDKRLISKRLAEARLRLLREQPFYGTLLLHLRFSLAKCGTAATDMKRILFDPDFIMRLTDSQVDFILMHELLHCALEHMPRRQDRNAVLFNIAADIVVNSIIMKAMDKKTFYIDDEEVMHLTPNGDEGYEYNVDEVYKMLLEKHNAMMRDIDELLDELERAYGNCIDDHELWEEVSMYDSIVYEWKAYVKSAMESSGANVSYIRDLKDDLEKQAKINWRMVLNSYISEIADSYDFSFNPPDRRFSEYILPSFGVIDSEYSIEDLWFLIDSSGSVSDEDLSDAFVEIKAAIEQFNHLSGKLSFFSTRVTEPIEFDSVESLIKLQPIGGGTSFHCIFEYMANYMMEKLPKVVIVLTDGYADYPDAELALGVPVIWIISAENKADAPWGTTIHI